MRIVLMALVVMAVSAPATLVAQTTDDQIAKALLAAPAALRANAGVIRLAADGTGTVLRESSNSLICWDRSDEPNREFAVQCTSEGNLARVKQNRAWNMSGKTADEIRAMRETAEADGTREVSVFGSAYYALSGADAESANLHTTIAVPFATTESLGFPDQGSYTATGTWIMEAGLSAAHIMLPGQ
ncbi:MAG: hypothetical protein VYE68_00395 [Acidobacteriota bacterium]|nr:hypothetical protein [Acidobacteriota bacterium]